MHANYCVYLTLVFTWDSTMCERLLACVQRYYPEIMPKSLPQHIASRNLFWASMKMAAKRFYVDGFWSHVVWLIHYCFQ